jgi:hypothetical protein
MSVLAVARRFQESPATAIGTGLKRFGPGLVEEPIRVPKVLKNIAVEQLKKVRTMTKKDGGDIADKVNQDEKNFPNLS